MTLLHVAVFCLFALLASWLLPPRWRGSLMLAASVVAIYWMQPASSIRHLGFWFPTATLAIAVLSWGVTRTQGPLDRRATLKTSLLVVAIVLALGVARYLGPVCCLTATRPPQITQLVVAVGFAALLGALGALVLSGRRLWLGLLAALIILAFLVLKTEPLGLAVSAWLRAVSGQSTKLASSLDLGWLGFSYVAFRLLHTVRDRVAGRLPDLSLQEYLTYVIFFPSFTAGPIDRVQRFVQDLRNGTVVDSEGIFEGGRRIALGILKKFVLADSLSLIALNPLNATQATSGLWLMVLLYAYSFQLYLDFSGYTDIAIGMGRWLGVRLPENFSRPYLTPNLTSFWNSWHITLAQWFRAYFFNPLTRALRTSRMRLPVWLVILVGQLTTMSLIGLWHGVRWNFLIWGCLQGLGLFVHNRWTEWSRPWAAAAQRRPWLQRLGQAAGVVITFHFMTLSWVWFALPTPALSLEVFRKLLGV